MAWRGFFSRSLMATARSSSSPPLRSLPPIRHLPPPSSAASPLRRRLPSRTFGELGCVQSLLPLHSVVVAAACIISHLSISAGACYDTYSHTCQDR